ncbi:unnamed protein product, partial [marine sediment metagenome]
PEERDKTQSAHLSNGTNKKRVGKKGLAANGGSVFEVPFSLIQHDISSSRIGELLIEAGLINSEELEEALSAQKGQGGKTVENLIKLGYIKPTKYLDFLAKLPGIASIILSNYTVQKDVSELLPTDFALKHEVFPIDKMGKRLTLAMACPLDAETIKLVEAFTGLKVSPLLCETTEIRKAIKQYAPKSETALFDNAWPQV